LVIVDKPQFLVNFVPQSICYLTCYKYISAKIEEILFERVTE